ncbi:ribosome small subunit-dependent GTPase A [soil metagenome]
MAEAAAAPFSPASVDEGLVGLGWDPLWEQAYEQAAAAHATHPSRPGRIMRTHRVGFDVRTPGGREFAVHKAERRDPRAAPATGDWVVVADLPEEPDTIITRVLPRRTAVIRRDPADRALPQVLAANADTVAVVHGADRPVNARRLERQLAVAHGSDARVVIVLTKGDLPQADATARAIEGAVPDEPIVMTSTATGRNLTAAAALIAGNQTLVLLGESGAGKSSLVNAVMGDMALATGGVRAGDAKGRHTTTSRELLAHPTGGAMLDTPGVRAIGLWPDATDLGPVFPEVTRASDDCRFRDCTHHNEPGCAVAKAVSTGLVDPERLHAWHRLVEEIQSTSDQLEQKGWR